jgi:hypothetical protein
MIKRDTDTLDYCARYCFLQLDYIKSTLTIDLPLDKDIQGEQQQKQ